MKLAAAPRIFRLFPRYWNDFIRALPLKETGEALAHLFFPPVCYYCKAPLDSRGKKKLCPDCLERLKLVEAPYCLRCSKTQVLLDEESLLCPDCQKKGANDPLSRILAGAAYEGIVPNLISKFKYGRCRYLASPLTDILEAHPEFPVLAPHVYCLIPVPMHWARKIIRGFNQAEDLAVELSRRTGIPVARALIRTRYHKPQASLSRDKRKGNLGGAFRCDKKWRSFFKRQKKHQLVVIIDDVCTTGTTAELCARQLKYAGAKNIILLTVAKT